MHWIAFFLTVNTFPAHDLNDGAQLTFNHFYTIVLNQRMFL